MKTLPSHSRGCLLSDDSSRLLAIARPPHGIRGRASQACSTNFLRTTCMLGLLSHGVTRGVPLIGAYDESALKGDSTFGPYHIVERLGKGGFGDVWLAEQQEPLRRKVALKLIRPGVLTPEAVSRFMRERRAMAMMEHENIAKVYDANSVDGMPYFAMEYVQGLAITNYAKAKNLTLRQRIGLFIPVCRAVHHAHQKQVLHRDLKPANILVTERDGVAVPKVIDFGIAKSLCQHPNLVEDMIDDGPVTQAGFRLGTPQYMSPEQALGLADIDAASDTYALGVILYELLVGEPPITKHEMENLAPHLQLDCVIRHQTRLPSTMWLTAAAARNTRRYDNTLGDNPKRISRQMRGDLDWIVRKALQKDRSERYASADKLADDLTAYLRNEPVSAGPPSLGYRMRKSFLRHQRVALAASLCLCAMLSCGLAFNQWQRAEAACAQESHAREQEASARAATHLAKEQARELVKFVLQDLGSKLQAVNQASLLQSVTDRAAAYDLVQNCEANFTPEQNRQDATLYRGRGPSGSSRARAAAVLASFAFAREIAVAR